VIDKDAVVHEVLLRVTPEEAFEMLVDPSRLIRWIGLSAELDPRPGGVFRFEVMSGQYCEGRYVVVERPHRVALAWGWVDPLMGVPPGSSRVEITLRPARGNQRATLLRLTHSRLSPDARPLHDDGWTRFLVRLTAVVEGREPGPYPTEKPQRRGRWLSTS
jgi:uncharacterized protein YndB with AHSA1/START domain